MSADHAGRARAGEEATHVHSATDAVGDKSERARSGCGVLGGGHGFVYEVVLGTHGKFQRSGGERERGEQGDYDRFRFGAPQRFVLPAALQRREGGRGEPGFKVNYIAINEGNLVPSSVQTMQAAIAEHPSAIVVGDFVTSSVDPLIKQAIAAGIPVYVNQSGQESWAKDGAFGFVGQQGGAAGNAAAEQMIPLAPRTTCA